MAHNILAEVVNLLSLAPENDIFQLDVFIART